MASPDDNRVLGRRGARELTVVEAEFVKGAGAINTLVCTLSVFDIRTQTHTGGDGDGCGDMDPDI